MIKVECCCLLCPVCCTCGLCEACKNGGCPENYEWQRCYTNYKLYMQYLFDVFNTEIVPICIKNKYIQQCFHVVVLIDPELM